MTVRFGNTITLDSLDYGDIFAFPNENGLYMYCGGDLIGCTNLYNGHFRFLEEEQMNQEVVKIDNLVLTTDSNSK